MASRKDSKKNCLTGWDLDLERTRGNGIPCGGVEVYGKKKGGRNLFCKDTGRGLGTMRKGRRGKETLIGSINSDRNKLSKL